MYTISKILDIKSPHMRDSVRISPRKSLRRHSQELGLSRALLNKVNQFLSLSSGLTFLKWYDCFLILKWKMTWFNMNYHINGLHLVWDTLYIPTPLGATKGQLLSWFEFRIFLLQERLSKEPSFPYDFLIVVGKRDRFILFQETKIAKFRI